jgi:hypothetical protein
MLELEFRAQVEQWMRETVVYPKINLLAPHTRELELLELAEPKNRRRGPADWMGNGLVGVGERLMALGESLASRRSDANSAS